MSEKKGYYSKEESHRKTWDKEEYEQRARERAKRLAAPEDDSSGDDEGGKTKNKKKKREDPVPKEPKPILDNLKAREGRVNLSGMLGKLQVVQVSGIASKQPGYYCKVCDVTIKDSISYLDHINGKKHVANLNMSLKTSRDTVDDVKAKLAQLKKKISDKETKKDYDFQDSIRQTKDLQEQRKAKKKESSKLKKTQKTETDALQSDAQIADLMG
ncbi:Zinc finger matrin-type protein 2 [Smittium mucronatum]|uniref:Zinc finger matrin-type protein 2 n=1 Tax=Smittium mucronatum TaxID=133383 RepID=A0A1R0H5U1_9FUNG|nr:Zinc finger matrin-type protein 2 [Smittium mucronatum]